ncbi:wax ester synthase/diacylglycerol acyltransferase 5-like [Mercurialis annua]|uniref:wax ester synthase/diacylglycerol acyltransferase 5-like n=1 Tax=Mercurialis annua TaxID=3986 RepID=UPI0021601670|nr:wax ester synthase/diacylglycerol acyltransferase 5-like [Mercurialis annua]
MAPPEYIPDEPLTPSGRLFLEPRMNTIIHCVLGVKNKMDVEAVKTTIKNSELLKQPRFCSLLVHDKNGFEYWRRTEVDMDKHIIVVDDKVNSSENEHEDVEKIVNDYIADLSVSSPLSSDKPLWELHVMVEKKCSIFRIHHALGDGISLMSLLMASCRTEEDPEAKPTLVAGGGGRRRGGGKGLGNVLWRSNFIMEVLKAVFFSVVFCLEFVLRCLWVCDRKTVISGGDGVEQWPRTVVTAKFLVEDMKAVKNAVANATINDVLFGVISAGLSKYLNHRSPNSLREGQQLTGLAMVNLRQQPELQDLTGKTKGNSGSKWGNKFGMFLLPSYYYKGLEPLEYVKRAQPMTNRKKNSLEAHFSYLIGDLIMHWLGPKFACMLNYRIVCNTTFTISNVIGPKEEITIAGNPITYIRVNTTSLPHALTMHMVSYAGKADMQILVAKDLIHDPEFLAKCFEESLVEMKNAAQETI